MQYSFLIILWKYNVCVLFYLFIVFYFSTLMCKLISLEVPAPCSFSFDLFKIKQMGTFLVPLLGETGVMTVTWLAPSVGQMLRDKNLFENDATGSLPSLLGTFFLIRLTISVTGRPCSDGGRLIPGLNWWWAAVKYLHCATCSRGRRRCTRGLRWCCAARVWWWSFDS